MESRVEVELVYSTLVSFGIKIWGHRWLAFWNVGTKYPYFCLLGTLPSFGCNTATNLSNTRRHASIRLGYEAVSTYSFWPSMPVNHHTEALAF